MKAWKAAALVAAIAGAGGIGAAVAPAAHAQNDRARPSRALEIFAGRGSHIGVSVRDVQEDDAKAGKLTAPNGVVIEDVREDSPAATAGFKKGDIVVEFDGERVRGARQFARLVQETPPGRKAAASLVRDGQRVSVTVEPREAGGFSFEGGGARVLRDFARQFDDSAAPVRPVPPVPPAPPAPPGFAWRSGGTLGLSVGDLPAQLAEYFGAKDGALVTSVSDDSAAARAGIKAGDVVTSFNGAEVTDPSDLRRRVQRLESGEEFTVGVVRDRKPLTLKGKVDAPRNRRTFRSEV